MHRLLLVSIAALFLLLPQKLGVATFATRTSHSHSITPRIKIQEGTASWYGPGFNGRKTASGARFDQEKMTAAHPTLPFGTKVRVQNMNTGKSVEVEITDRGPFSKGRVIDLSKAAARELALLESGIAPVTLWRVD